jgi:hypothetical protein
MANHKWGSSLVPHKVDATFFSTQKISSLQRIPFLQTALNEWQKLANAIRLWRCSNCATLWGANLMLSKGFKCILGSMLCAS